MPRPVIRRWLNPLLTLLLLTTAGLFGAAALAPPARADGCYTWTRNMTVGMSGEDVRQLQLRIAGWVDYREVLSVDGNFGARTEAAVRRFQAAYGLGADGEAGPQTQGRLYELQDDDCTPIHFSYAELDEGCGGSGYSGGKVGEAAARGNALRVMWKLEALRRKLGDRPVSISSGFRSIWCNQQSGGASNSMHLYGAAADMGSGNHSSFCDIARQAIRSGFTGIVGPGAAGHNDHTHVDIRREINGTTFFDAPSCSNFP